MAEINVTGASALYMKVDITNIRQNVAGNSSTVKFVASMRQTSGKNFNQVPGVDFKVVVNGTTLANKTGFFLDVRGNVTQVFHTADVVIPHNTDGTKSFSWSFWFDPKGMWSTYKPTTLSGTQALPRIARVSNATLSANTFDFGESFTVYTNQTDPSFTHTISYIRGTTVTSLATAVKTSKAVTIPTAQISNYTTATTASMKIRTSTYSGSTLVGDYDLDVTVKVPSTAVPKIGAVSFTGSNAVFTANTQFIASRDRLKATVADVVTSYSSPIKKYLYRVSQRTTFSMEGTTNGATFPTFNFPATGSEVVNIQMAVVDARGRQSAWSTSVAIRVHAYQPPSIGAMTITRNANVTTVNVKRNWSVTPLYESGNTTTPKNTGALVINYRKVGDTTWSSTNGGASGLSGNNSSVALTGFAGGTSYEFQIKLTDKFQTTTAPIIKIGTEFVPLDIGPKGAGVGKIHSDGTANLEVGAGGIISDGTIRGKGTVVSEGLFQANITANLNGMTRVLSNGMYNTLGMGGLYLANATNVGTIVLTMPSGHNGMFSATINIRSYNYSASFEVSGYTYTGSTTGWHSDKSFGNIVGGNLNVRFRHNGGSARYISIGELNTDWGGYLQVTVENVKSGHGGAFGGRIGVSLSTSWPGNAANNTYYLRPLFNTANDGSGSSLDADLLDGLHASAFARSITSDSNGNGNWYNLDGKVLICSHRFYINTWISGTQVKGTWTFPVAFKYAPAVSIAGRSDTDTSGPGFRRSGRTSLNIYGETTAKADILYSIADGDFPKGEAKYVNMFAVGVPV